MHWQLSCQTIKLLMGLVECGDSYEMNGRIGGNGGEFGSVPAIRFCIRRAQTKATSPTTKG